MDSQVFIIQYFIWKFYQLQGILIIGKYDTGFKYFIYSRKKLDLKRFYRIFYVDNWKMAMKPNRFQIYQKYLKDYKIFKIQLENCINSNLFKILADQVKPMCQALWLWST